MSLAIAWDFFSNRQCLCEFDSLHLRLHSSQKKRKEKNSTKFSLETFLSMCYVYTDSEFILFFTFFVHSSNIPPQIHKAISSFTFCRTKCAWAESDEQEICINFPATTSSQTLSFTGRDHKHAMNRLYVLGAFPPSVIISKLLPQTPCLPSDELAKHLKHKFQAPSANSDSTVLAAFRVSLNELNTDSTCKATSL